VQLAVWKICHLGKTSQGVQIGWGTPWDQFSVEKKKEKDDKL
jgi:hypothetical protein